MPINWAILYLLTTQLEARILNETDVGPALQDLTTWWLFIYYPKVSWDS